MLIDEGSNVIELIGISAAKCDSCMLCAISCPVHAIKLTTGNEVPVVIHERCIGCGDCIAACPSEAITYRDSTAELKAVLVSGRRVAAIVDPSISAEFPDITDYRKFAGMIRMLGFSFVAEISFAIEMLARQYTALLTSSRGKYYLSSLCPSAQMYIEKYYPQLTANLVPLKSPTFAMASVIRKEYGSDVAIVAITPLIAEKILSNRIRGDSAVDVAITFVELRQLFKEHNITETTLEYSDFDPPYGRIGSLYPIAGAFAQLTGVNDDPVKGNFLTAAGKKLMISTVKEFFDNSDRIRKHFNLSYHHGTMTGPGMTNSSDYFLKYSLVTDYTSRRSKAVDIGQWEAMHKKFGTFILEASYIPDDQRLPVPPDDQIDEIISTITKNGLYSKEACNLCGYFSCREFAISVAQGLVKTEMCIPYSLRTKEEYIYSLRKTNEQLINRQKQLVSSEQQALQESETARYAFETLGVLMQKLPAGVVIVDESLRIIESNRSFVAMLGDEAALINDVIPGLKGADLKTLLPFGFYNLFKYVLSVGDDVIGKDVAFADNLLNVSIYSIIRNKICGAVIRDMYLPEVQKEELVNRLTEVIDENLKMVQEIGFLLGEGAAKTEKMLQSLIETHRGKPKR